MICAQCVSLTKGRVTFSERGVDRTSRATQNIYINIKGETQNVNYPILSICTTAKVELQATNVTAGITLMEQEMKSSFE